MPLGSFRLNALSKYEVPSGYTTPTAEFTDDADTKLLLKFNGNYNDTNTSGRTAKTIQTLDSPSRNSTIKKFGTESLLIDASASVLDRVYTTSTNSDFFWMNQNFTLEFWTYVPSFTDMTYPYSSGLSKQTGQTVGGDWGWSFGFISDATLRFYYWNGSGPSFITSTVTAAINTWHHCMLDYRHSDGRIRMGLNGEFVGEATKVGTPSTGGTQFTIGSVRVNSPNFYIDELRVSHSLRY